LGLGYNNAGQLGDGNNTNSAIPVQVSGLTQVVGIAAGGSNGLAVRADGTVWTWGSGYYLGNDTTADSYVPVQVNGLTKIVAVAGG